MPKDRSLDALVGELICPNFEGRVDAKPEWFENVLDLVRKGMAGGAVLFRGEKRESTGLIARLRKEAPGPIYVACDMEFGAATQVRGATPLPSNMAIASAGEAEALAFEKGRLTAMEARAVGVDVVFAPCVDVNTNPANPIIGVRSFGEEPGSVGLLGAAMVRGLHAGGAADCIKHFPGHGDTSVDSHIGLPVLSHDRERLDKTELAPFRACIGAGSFSAMAGHIAVPALTGDERLPATLSKEICTNLLRKEMGFDGVLFTDAMIMGGIVEGFGEEEAAVRAIGAGCDVLLYPKDPGRAFAALVKAVESGTLPLGRVEEAAARVDALTAWTGEHNPGTTLSFVGSLRNEEKAREMAAQTITLLRDPTGSIPLPVGAKVCLVIFDTDDSSAAGATLKRMLKVEQTIDRVTPETGDDGLRRVKRHAQDADVTVAAIFSEGRAWKGSSALPENMAGLLYSLATEHERMVAASFSTPYLLAGFPANTTLLAISGAGRLAEEAAAAVLLGKAPASGRIPVTIQETIPVGAGMN
jgi:beta-N-acetylhexosaminidase